MIRYELTNNVARITLDTPETGNKFTYQLMLDFIAALTAAGKSGAAVLILQAIGNDFSLGRDHGEKLENVSRRDNLKLILKANSLLRQFPGVSVALIQGRGMAFASGLALQSDISIGADNAVLGFNEIRHGLAPLVVVTYLADYVGPKVAKELIYTGRDVTAEEAVRIGLLNRIVPAGDLASEGERLVSELTTFPPGALRLIHNFYEDLKNINDEDPALVGVDRLVTWIEAGKP
ncbi:MAG: enoyl-CoA hydratase/isomerase family protein [Hyphomicrobium sp.]|uniref:enoyl-CoA hydratase/isomerase family protein n=1 Tax=Hyphomicrobium sp. TaxID=82 RepID=UPI0039E2E9E8